MRLSFLRDAALALGLAATSLAGQNYNRPVDPTVAARYARQYPKVRLFTIDEVFGGWARAQKAHFADGGSFDKVYLQR